jgi:hypothetical protein
MSDAMTKQTISEVEKLVKTIDKLPDLNRANVERVLGVHLSPSDDDPQVWEAHLPSGPFAEVAFFEPRADQKQARVSLGLKMKPETLLPLSEFPPDLLGDILDINPRIPPEGTVTRGRTGFGRDRLLEFRAASHTLWRATFRRDVKR